MTTKNYTHVVGALDQYSYGHERFENLADAENHARKQAFKSGADYGIYTLTAQASAPSIVNDVKITAVQ